MFEKQKHLLAKRKAANAFRFLKQSDRLEDFCSNDYLSFTKVNHKPQPSEEPKGSGGSRLLAGNYPQIEELEAKLAEYHKCESALVFNSGYNANVGFFSAVPQKGDTILYDELIHASVKEGMRLSFAKNYSFKHNDLSDLEQKLLRAEGDVYVAIEAVYSMDGDSAPLEQITSFCEQRNLILVVDEAHSVGVFGEKGEGLAQHLNVHEKVPVRIVTFGKAIGAHGAAVLGGGLLKDFLINFSRSFIYTTALPVGTIKSVDTAYHLLEKGTYTKVLREKINLFTNEFKGAEDFGLIKSESAIQCVLFPGNNEVKLLAENLQAKGFDVRPVLSPTVKVGQERIRVCLHNHNSNQQIIALAQAIQIEIIQTRNN